MGEAKRRAKMDPTFGANPRVTKKNEVIAYCLETGIIYATGESTMERGKRKAEAKYPQSNFSYQQGGLPELLQRIVPVLKPDLILLNT